MLDGLFDKVLDLVLLRDIGRDGQNLPCKKPEISGNYLQILSRAGGKNNIRSAVSKCFGYGAA